MQSEGEATRAAAEAAERVIFSRLAESEIVDLDVTVQFENAELTVDIYFETAADVDTDPTTEQAIVEDAARAAAAAVDERAADL